MYLTMYQLNKNSLYSLKLFVSYFDFHVFWSDLYAVSLGPDSVRDMTVSNTFSDAFTVTWKPPLKPNGELTGYSVE